PLLEQTSTFPNLTNVISAYPGKDLSPLFPTFTLLARSNRSADYQDPVIQRCVELTSVKVADQWLRNRIEGDTGYNVEGQRLVSCPDPLDPTSSTMPCFYTASSAA